MEQAVEDADGVLPDVIIEDAHVGLIDDVRHTTVVKLHGCLSLPDTIVLARESAGAHSLANPPRSGTVCGDMHTHDTPGPLAGKVALVTGAAGGLGQAIARAFDAQGAAVAVADLPSRAGELDTLAADFARATGVPLDVREPHTIQAAVQ